MRAVFVVVADVFREQTFQMAFVHRDDVIQQISSAALDPTLRDSILPGTLERSSHTGLIFRIERPLEPPSRTSHPGRR